MGLMAIDGRADIWFTRMPLLGVEPTALAHGLPHIVIAFRWRVNRRKMTFGGRRECYQQRRQHRVGSVLIC